MIASDFVQLILSAFALTACLSFTASLVKEGNR